MFQPRPNVRRAGGPAVSTHRARCARPVAAASLALILAVAPTPVAAAQTVAITGGTVIDGTGAARSPTAWCWSPTVASPPPGRQARPLYPRTRP